MTSTVKKILLGALVSLAILAACLIVLTRVEGMPSLAESNLSLVVLLAFFAAVSAIYAFSVFLWTRFYALFGENRGSQDAFIDMGLIAIGKYLPGKIWGILFRGAVNQDGVSLKKHRVVISAAEQGYSLFVGLLLVGFLVLSNYAQLSTSNMFLLAVVMLVLCALGLKALFMTISVISSIPRFGINQTLSPVGPVLLRSIALAIGYICLWVLTAVPLLILILNNQSLQLQQLVSITAAFLAAMIAGWLAIFAPGGIGIRETAFVYLAPEFFTWQDGLFWITLHRTLFTLFDLAYGAATLLIIAYRTKMVVVK